MAVGESTLISVDCLAAWRGCGMAGGGAGGGAQGGRRKRLGRWLGICL